MAILSNINDKFAVDSTGAIQFNGQAGTSGYVLKSNGNAAPTWVDASTVIGGPYLPLSGGTLTGATATASGISFTVGGVLNGTSATFAGNVTLSQPINGADADLILVSKSSVGNSRTSYINWDADAEKLKTYVSGTLATTIDSAGNVGIGTGTPTANYPLTLRSKVGDYTKILDWGTDVGGSWGTMQISMSAPYATELRSGAWNFAQGNVGIGTDSPDNQLHIASTGTPVINLERVDDLLGAGNVISVLRSTSLTNKIISQISTECDLNYTSKGRLIFYTNDGTNPVERMRIDSSGNIGIGQLPYSYSRLSTEGSDNTSSNYAFIAYNENTDAILACRNDGQVTMPTGNVGIKNTNPSAFNSLGGGGLVIGDGTQTNNLTLFSATTGASVGYGHIAFADSNASGSTAQYSGLIQYYHGTDEMSFYTDATPRMVIKSGGDFGFNETTITNPYGQANFTDLNIDGTWGGVISFKLGGTEMGWIGQRSSGNQDMVLGASSGQDLLFYTNGTNERMRITSGGEVLIRRVSSASTSFSLQVGDGVSDSYRPIRCEVASTSTRTQIAFHNPGQTAAVGAIQTYSTSTVYTTGSDYRLKENVVEMTGALDRINQLRPSRFNFIADTDLIVDGFLAHEVQDIVPEAITGEKDAVDEDGNPIYQGIDQSKLVPLLVGAIKELEARVKELENK